MLCEDLNITDHYKHLEDTFGIADELCAYAGFDTHEAAAAEAAEAQAKLEAQIKSEKNQRKESIDRTMLSVIEMTADVFQIKSDEIIDNITDMEAKTQSLHSFFQKNGSEALIFSYSPTRNDENRIGILRERELQTEQCAIVYRTDNAMEITPKNMPNLLNLSDIKPDENWSTTILLARIFREVWLPAFIHFGQDNTDTLMVLKACELFLENCDHITKNPIALTIDGDFYETNLSTPEKIQLTSENRGLVKIVENISNEWMRIIEKILIRGKVTRRATPATGPIDELEYWLQMHSLYSIAQEQMSMETFQNHLKCLKLSGSKLVHKWKDIANKLEIANCEASENVQFLNSLERFHFPLYANIDDIKNHVQPLFVALRTVYKTSAFYNTPNSVASFLSKCTNHLTLSCRNFIMTDSPSNLFLQPHEQLLSKIAICLELLRAYRSTFDETLNQMRAAGEPEWNFSEKYVFGQSNQLVDRLSKIQNIVETDRKYAVLENILIENIQDFYVPIKNAYDEISNKSYDHLDYRQEQFDVDFDKWQNTIKHLEAKMHSHVQKDINQFPTSPLVALQHLKRFEGLEFDCLTIRDRYIDIVNVFMNNINFLKDAFNLTKANHIVPNLMCQNSGRISWVRSIEMKLNEVINLVQRDDLFDHEKRLIVQNTIKFYNALSKDLTLYEFQQYKAWFDNVNFVYDSLNQPVIRKNPMTNRLEVNFDINILNTLEEGKKMIKLHLDMPTFGEALVKYEDDLKRKLGKLTQLIVLNNEMRLSIHVVFVNTFRPQLQNIDNAFKPGLSQIQWLSKDFDSYIDNVKKVITDVDCLLKRATDRKIFHIEDIILSMNELQSLILSDEPIDINKLLHENEKHKRETEKILCDRSTMAEKATVQLINLFISQTDITSEDKYDFITFENLFQAVFVYSDGDHIQPLFKDYAELQYGIEQLHSDCMDIFNYFIHQILDGMIKSTKKAYDMIRDYFFHKEEPAILTVAKLDTSSCIYLSPDLDSMSETFLLLIRNITNIFANINAWGEHAAIPGSKKYEFDVSMLRGGFFKNVTGNKEIQRAQTQFDSGLSLLQPQIDALLKELFEEYRYLWDENNERHIEEFIEMDPTPSAIEDEFSRYQKILDDLENTEKIAQVDCIAIDLSEIFEQFLEYARKWKSKQAERLATIYKGKFDEVNDFIRNTQIVLRRELKDEEEFTAAIECLVNVYKHIDRMETLVFKTSETYNILVKFNEPIGNVDKNEIDQLNVRYAKMFADTKVLEVHIRNNIDEILAKI